MPTVPGHQASLSTTHSLPMACTSSFCLMRAVASAFRIKLFVPSLTWLWHHLWNFPDSLPFLAENVASLCAVWFLVPPISDCLPLALPPDGCQLPVSPELLACECCPLCISREYLVPGRCFRKRSACLLLFLLSG